MTQLAIINVAIALLAGLTVEVGGAAVAANDLINDAKYAANRANVWQLNTALELYYMDNNTYPLDSDAEAMIARLLDEGYIRNKPLDISVFTYTPINNGQNYVLHF